MASIWIHDQELENIDDNEIEYDDVMRALKINGAERITYEGGGVWNFYYARRPWMIYYLFNQYDVNFALNEIEKQLWSE